MKDGRDRLLPHLRIHGTITPEVCSMSCVTKNYKYSGVENGNECWCGNVTPPLEKIVSPNDCRAKCSGNSSQVCGGGWRINVYETGTYLYGYHLRSKKEREGKIGLRLRKLKMQHLLNITDKTNLIDII